MELKDTIKNNGMHIGAKQQLFVLQILEKLPRIFKPTIGTSTIYFNFVHWSDLPMLDEISSTNVFSEINQSCQNFAYEISHTK